MFNTVETALTSTMTVAGQNHNQAISVVELQLLLSHMEQQMVTILFEQQQRSFQNALEASMLSNKPVTRPADDAAIEELETKVLKHEDCFDDVGMLQSCSICLEPFEEEERCTKMPCSHVFHGECLRSWLSRQNSCPVCRKEIKQKEVVGGELNQNQNLHHHPFEILESDDSSEELEEGGGGEVPEELGGEIVEQALTPILSSLGINNNSTVNNEVYVLEPGTAGDTLLLGPGTI
ncbi:hypothetical protein ScalyP_jg4814 [Parmales sp. scaly parma]|nr:hypothetical protein ScalyP_jg4814 [Parmales sp. scaly parma]